MSFFKYKKEILFLISFRSGKWAQKISIKIVQNTLQFKMKKSPSKSINRTLSKKQLSFTARIVSIFLTVWVRVVIRSTGAFKLNHSVSVMKNVECTFWALNQVHWINLCNFWKKEIFFILAQAKPFFFSGHLFYRYIKIICLERFMCLWYPKIKFFFFLYSSNICVVCVGGRVRQGMFWIYCHQGNFRKTKWLGL